MYYCFVEEDMVDLNDDNQLIIQAKYAKRLGLFCSYRISEGIITDQEERSISLNRKPVLLRATCDTMAPAVNFLKGCGAELLETLDDIQKIENWDNFLLARRRIFSIRVEEIFETSFSSNVENFLSATPRVFIKSRKKGFCVRLPSSRLLKADTEILDFFKSHCADESYELILSEELGIKADSLGLKETRHFVFNGAIANSSRALHSIKHAVPRTLLEKATSLVKFFLAQDGFPKNYVIDVAEFQKDGESFLDIIELNPVTSSLCYVNNSIFDIVVPEATAFWKKTGMGYEYCYDAIEHPSRYAQKRYSGACYEYNNIEHYNFL